MKVLFLSAEAAPFAKTGGLGDVCGSLPKALRGLGHDVRVVLPAYNSVEEAARQGRLGVRTCPLRLRVPLGFGAVDAGVLEATLPGSDVPVYFIAEWQLFGGRHTYGYRDDPYRFAFFSRAALDLTVAALGWRPAVVHGHDWHAAPAVMWLATAGRADPQYAGLPTVFTIHNLMHQGNSPWQVCRYLGLLTHGLHEERYGEVNFMARGIYHATLVNTVSPTYAREILTYEGGCGLDGLLRHRGADVCGILNGLDPAAWDPADDPHLAARFDAGSLDRRAANKQALQARAGLPQRGDVPLVALVTRLAWQKGLGITGHALHLLLNGHAGEAQCVVLGAGDPEYERMLLHLAGYHGKKMAAFLGYDADLAQLIYGGSDLFLMPSLFEPCGLGQMIAMRYGSVPVVRATGGLADTVRHGVTGFTFTDYTADAFWAALRDALHVFRADPDGWRAIQQNGMACDFSWQTSARSYQQLYERAVARAGG